MARKLGAMFYLFNRRVHSAASLVTQNKDQRRTENTYSIFKTRDGIVIGEIAGHAAHEHVAATGVERVFRSDTGVSAAEDAGKRVLSQSERRPFSAEIVTEHTALDITMVAFHEAIQSRVGGQDVLRFRGWAFFSCSG